MYRFNAHDNQIAMQMFDRAIAADPNFARAHAGLSFTHFQNAFVGYTRDIKTEHRLTREFAEKGMALDPLDPFANLNMGRAEWLVGNLESSFPWYDRCVELNPNYAFAHYNRALADSMAGRGGEGETGAMKAMALSPIDPLRYAMLATRAFSHIVRGEYTEASGWADRGALSPNAHVHIEVVAALANALAGNRPAAERWATGAKKRAPGYSLDSFFKAFPFQDDAMVASSRLALEGLGL